MRERALGLCDRIPSFCEEVGPERLIVLMAHGSHLYGTDTPNSDLDVKGVFIPTKHQVLTGTIPNHYTYSRKKGEGERNGRDDVDIQLFSLHYFLKLLTQGETLAIDMTHARDHQCYLWAPVWEDLHGKRSLFYTRNMTAFIGYARSQAAKYGIKGSRLDAVKTVIDRLSLVQLKITGKHNKMKDVWNALPEGEHIHKLEPNPRDKNGNRIYQVVGKQFLESTPIPQVVTCLQRFYDEYGSRAKLASENKGIDWKAVSHAVRAAQQLEEIFMTGDLCFPLAGADVLKQIKQGLHPWEKIQGLLEECIAEVERLAAKSTYPEQVNLSAVQYWLVQIMEKEIIDDTIWVQDPGSGNGEVEESGSLDGVLQGGEDLESLHLQECSEGHGGSTPTTGDPV